MIETLAHGYLSESTQRELFNQYQHDRVKMVIKNLGILVLLMKAASALERLRNICVLRQLHYTIARISKKLDLVQPV